MKASKGIWSSKAMRYEDPLISHGIISYCLSEYVEEEERRKREYAPKIMVATST